MLPSAIAQVSAATVNRKLAAVSTFYELQARNGTGAGDLLATWRAGGRGGWKPFLHHISKDTPYRGRAVTVKAPQRLPRILTAAEMQAILDACTRLRDRFFFALLHEGCRAGEALGLRHEDIAAAEREISIVPRENANGARAESGQRTIPVGAELIRLYADYLHGEYGGIDSDYVFINIWAEPRGQAWSYPAVYDLVRRLRAKTGIDFDPHWFRHSMATRLQGRGVASDATFRGWREGGVAGPAALPGVRRACGRAAGHAVDQGFLAAGCGGCQDVASESVALDDRWLHLASRVEGAVWGQCGGRWRWWLPMARCRFRPVPRCWRRCWPGGAVSSRRAG